MKKGFLASARKTNGVGISSSPPKAPQEKNSNSSHSHPHSGCGCPLHQCHQRKNPNSGNGFFLAVARERDAKVDFTHVRCGTQITRLVDKQSLDRGLVVVRCIKCGELIPVADHGNFFAHGVYDRVEKVLRGLGLNLPAKGVHSPLCATFEGPDCKPEKGFLKNGNGFSLVASGKRDAKVDFIHARCHTQIIRMVDKQALERGVVVVRCGGCDDLFPVADNGYLFEDGGHDKVEKYLSGLRGTIVPPKGSHSSYCATFESPDWFTRKTGKGYGEVADSTATRFGQAQDMMTNKDTIGDCVAAIKKERDHDVAFTHPNCGTKLVRKVSREAIERGAVVARCSGCNQLVSLADCMGWFGSLKNPSSLERFLTTFMAEIKQGSEDTFCVTVESMDCWEERNQGEK